MPPNEPGTNGNAPLQPTGSPLPEWPEDKPVEITPDDIQAAVDEWNRAQPKQAGLLDAPAWDPAIDGPEPKRPRKEVG